MGVIFQPLKMAIKSISSNKLRSFLTMLGIIIGVMALVIMVSLVNGVTTTVTDTISDLGTSLIVVSVMDDKGKPIEIDDIEKWSDKNGVGNIAPVQELQLKVKSTDKTETVQVCATTEDYCNIQAINVLIGRFINNVDITNATKICVVNEAMAEDTFESVECLGEMLWIEGLKYQIVGVLEDNEYSVMTTVAPGTSIVYVPYTTFSRISPSGTSSIYSFYASPAVGSSASKAETTLKELLNERFNDDEDAYTTFSQDALEDTMSSIAAVLAVLLGGIAAISLIVGGIGIMNIMLVTVTERTREIGIRKAIGASRKVILRQFLIESIILCMLGCAFGIWASWGALRIIDAVADNSSLSISIDASVVLIAVTFCFIIGIIFGLYPANKAAKMKPIDALHYGG